MKNNIIKQALLMLLFIGIGNAKAQGMHWTWDSHAYSDNSTFVGVITINGIEQRSDQLEIGAFCDNTCRGSIICIYNPVRDRYYACLTVNGEEGMEMTFRLWNHATNSELDVDCDITYTFHSNDMSGSMSNPYEFAFTGNVQIQTIDLISGWNWVSIGIAVDDPVAMLEMLQASLGENASEIQSLDYMTEFDGEEWFGDLDDEGVFNEQMYLINAENDCTIELSGIPAVADEYEITILPGWNWIGFPSAVPIDVADALADFDATEGDEIQSLDYMTEFDGEEWFGDLETLEPGQGLLYFSNSTETKYLIFSTGAKK